MGGLWITGGSFAEKGVVVATGLGLLTEAITCAGAAVSEASLLAVEVRVRLTEGALTAVAGVFGGAVVLVEVELSVDLIVIEGEDITGAEMLVNAIWVVEGFAAVGIGVEFILMLVEGSEAGVESELGLTEQVLKLEDLVNVVMMVLGLAVGEEVDAVFVRCVKD